MRRGINYLTKTDFLFFAADSMNGFGRLERWMFEKSERWPFSLGFGRGAVLFFSGRSRLQTMGTGCSVAERERDPDGRAGEKWQGERGDLFGCENVGKR